MAYKKVKLLGGSANFRERHISDLCGIPNPDAERKCGQEFQKWLWNVWSVI